MEHKLDELVQKLKSAAADNLKAVVLYGSAVTDEFHAGHSNLNTLCLVARAGPAQLEVLHPPVEWWVRQGHVAPLVFTLEELRRCADIFAIELLDMQAHHRMLLGEDFFAGITVPLRYHKRQVERELRTNWLRLRQAFLVAPKKAKIQLDLMISSVSSFSALFRHALIACGEKSADGKREAIERVAKLFNSDAGGFLTILDLREEKKKEKDINVEETFRRYLALVDAVTNEVDRRLDEGLPQ
jgi:hypothetical protein